MNDKMAPAVNKIIFQLPDKPPSGYYSTWYHRLMVICDRYCSRKGFSFYDIKMAFQSWDQEYPTNDYHDPESGISGPNKIDDRELWTYLANFVFDGALEIIGVTKNEYNL